MHVYFSHWHALKGEATNSGQKFLEKKELFTLEENLRWTSASSAKLFLSWAQASPSVLKENKDNDHSLPHPSSWDLSDESSTTLCTRCSPANQGNRNVRKQPTFVTKAGLCWHCLLQILETTVHDNLHLQRCQSLHKQDPTVSYPYHNKVSTNAVFPLPLLLYTLLHRTDFYFRWKITEMLFSTWKLLHCLFLSHCFQDSGSWGQPRFLWKHHNQNYTVLTTVQLQGLNW